jgi:hypothetical protein
MPPLAAAPVERYYTEHKCTRCGAEVHGLHGRWTCKACGECSPDSEPPEGWLTEIRPGDTAAPPPAPRRPRRRR